MFYKFFPHLPFYAKWGAIPESYLIALSYEEQLLWLCKMITDLDSKIDESFATLKKYIDDNLYEIGESLNHLASVKQDKLIAGENIQIDGNVISAIYDDNLNNHIMAGSTVPYEVPIGDTLPLPPYQEENSAYAIIENIRAGEVYKIKGRYSAYIVRTSDNHIVARQDDFGSDMYLDFVIPESLSGTYNLVIGWHNTNEHTPSLLKAVDFDTIYRLIQEKQDKLHEGAKINIYTSGDEEYIEVKNGEDIRNISVLESYYPETYNVRDTLPPNPQAGTSSQFIVEFDVQAGDVLNLKGKLLVYIVTKRTLTASANFITEKYITDSNDYSSLNILTPRKSCY